MLPSYDLEFVAAYFDETGLYAYGRQPQAVFWNLKQLAGALNLICPKDLLVNALQSFGDDYQKALAASVIKRLSVRTLGHAKDLRLVAEIFSFLNESKTGFEQFFFDWYGGMISAQRVARSPAARPCPMSIPFNKSREHT